MLRNITCHQTSNNNDDDKAPLAKDGGMSAIDNGLDKQKRMVDLNLMAKEVYIQCIYEIGWIDSYSRIGPVPDTSL